MFRKRNPHYVFGPTCNFSLYFEGSFEGERERHVGDTHARVFDRRLVKVTEPNKHFMLKSVYMPWPKILTLNMYTL